MAQPGFDRERLLGLTWSPIWASVKRGQMPPSPASRAGVKLTPLGSSPQVPKSASTGFLGSAAASKPKPAGPGGKIAPHPAGPAGQARSASGPPGRKSRGPADPAAALPGVKEVRRKLEAFRKAVAADNGGTSAFLSGDDKPADEKPTKATWRRKKKWQVKNNNKKDEIFIRDPLTMDNASYLPGVTDARQNLALFASLAKDPAVVESFRAHVEAEEQRAAEAAANAAASPPARASSFAVSLEEDPDADAAAVASVHFEP